MSRIAMQDAHDEGEDTLPEADRDTLPMLRAAQDRAVDEDGRITIFARGYGVLAGLARKP